MGTARTKPATITVDQNEARRTLLDATQHRYDPRFIARFSPAAGVFVSQLLYWSDKGRDPVGWIYKSKPEMQKETGLSRRQQDTARKILKAKGVLEEELRRSNNAGPSLVLHYRLDMVRLCELLGVNLNGSDTDDPGEFDGGDLEDDFDIFGDMEDEESEAANVPGNSGPVNQPGIADRLTSPVTGPVNAPDISEPIHAHRLPLEITASNTSETLRPQTCAPDASASLPRRTPTMPSAKEIIEEGKGSGEPLTDHEATRTKPDPAPEKLDPATVGKVCDLLWKPDTDAGRLASRCVEDEHITSRQVAEVVADRLDRTPDTADRYLETVEDALEILKKDVGRVAV